MLTDIALKTLHTLNPTLQKVPDTAAHTLDVIDGRGAGDQRRGEVRPRGDEYRLERTLVRWGNLTLVAAKYRADVVYLRDVIS